MPGNWKQPTRGTYSIAGTSESGPGLRIAAPVNDVLPGAMPGRMMSRRRRLVEAVKALAKDIPSPSDRAKFMAYAQWFVSTTLDDDYLDTKASAATATLAAPVIQSLDTIIQGTGVNKRTGKMVIFRRLRCQIDLSLSQYYPQTGGGANANDHVFLPISLRGRVLIFQWMPDTDPDAASILEVPSGSDYIHGFYNHEKRKLFRIMFDRTYLLNAPALNKLSDFASATATGPYAPTAFDYGLGVDTAQMIEWVELANWKNERRRYIDATGDDGTGRLYVMYIPSHAAATGQPTVNFNATVFRLHYSN